MIMLRSREAPDIGDLTALEDRQALAICGNGARVVLFRRVVHFEIVVAEADAVQRKQGGVLVGTANEAGPGALGDHAFRVTALDRACLMITDD